jgi:hypothetical protein
MLLWILGAVIGLDMITTFGTSLIGGGEMSARGVVRILLTIGLAFAVFTGKKWAKWTLGVLLILGALVGAWAAFMLGMLAGTIPVVIFGAMAAIHGTAGITLLVSKDIEAYLNSHDTIRLG